MRSLPLLLLPAACLAAAPVEFNRDVRPILSDRCFGCHGPDPGTRQAGLRLDVETEAKKELRPGRTAVAPGDPARSELYRRITSPNQNLRMPPAYLGHAPLREGQIALLKRWIESGGAYQKHWSFLPPRKAELPAAGKHPIDAFVHALLAAEGLKPSPAADAVTLLRRVTLDLTGLPPAPEEVTAYLKADPATRYGSAVDRLLASPRYAERMAVRWLDAARYADTNGYQTDGERSMWRWRDWVLDAFRRNLPFDRFTIEQLAGDLLPDATREQIIATGFHRNHRTSAEGGIVPEEFRTEYVADRAETTATVWLGLTLGCARCHDHKYDPLPQRDFYRLFAFFNNVPEKGLVYNWGNDEPMIKAPTPEQERKLRELDDRLVRLRARWDALRKARESAQRRWEKRGAAADKFLARGLQLQQGLEGAAGEFDGQRALSYAPGVADFNYLDPFTFAARVRPETEKGAILTHYEDYWEGSGHGLFLLDGRLRLHIIFRWTDIGMRVETGEPLRQGAWQHVAATYDGARYASGVRIYVDGLPRKLRVLFDELNWPMNFKVPFRIGAGAGLGYRGGIADARVYSRALTSGEVAALGVRETAAALARIKPDQRTAAQQQKLRLAFLETGAPRRIREAEAELRAAEEERRRFHASIPTVMVMKEGPDRPAFVLRRGAYDAPGERVRAGVPAALPPLASGVPANRLALARWLVSRANPLTARVTVNRFWQMLFGTGLVKTVEDFGAQGEWPVHPELLDWLAVEFMDSGWDVRHILKTIVMSATYRQGSRASRELIERDPENRLLARAPRLRLSSEMLRDTALAVSGLLVERFGGPSVKPYQPPGLWQELAGGKGYEPDQGEGLYRRSLYTYWKRTVAPPSMVNFDAPSREFCTVRETRTNTPLQALTLMNETGFVEAARKLAERVLREERGADGARIGRAFRLVLARAPRESEIRKLLAALAEFRALYHGGEAAALRLLAVGDSPRDPRLDPRELAAWSALASLLLNLDEAVTRE